METELEVPFKEGGWDTEALELISEDSCTVDCAVEAITLRYLRDGDWRPLLDAALHGHAHGAAVMVYLAAMLDPKWRIMQTPRYGLGFKEIRNKGRPKKVQASYFTARTYAVLVKGTRQLAVGINPDRAFWCSLLAALDSDHSGATQGDGEPSFPLRAKVQLTEGGRGRRSDPELPMRDKVLARMVQQRIDRGEKYETAIDDTLKTLQAEAQAEAIKQRYGSISRRTVRNAYDWHAQAKPPK